MSKTIIMLSRLIKVCNRLATATSTGRIRPPTFTEPRWEPTTTSSSGTTSLFWRRRAGTRRPWRRSWPTRSRRSWPLTWRWRWSSCSTLERWTCPPGGRGKICEKLENSVCRLWLRVKFDFRIPNPWAEGKRINTKQTFPKCKLSVSKLFHWNRGLVLLFLWPRNARSVLAASSLCEYNRPLGSRRSQRHHGAAQWSTWSVISSTNLLIRSILVIMAGSGPLRQYMPAEAENLPFNSSICFFLDMYQYLCRRFKILSQPMFDFYPFETEFSAEKKNTFATQKREICSDSLSEPKLLQ